MGSVFRRRGSDIWIGSVRAWDAARGKWRHVPQSTGQTDKAKALGIVATLEGVAAQAKAGSMTREKAQSAVADILRLAGVDLLQVVPSFHSMATAFIGRASLAASSAKIYESVLTSLEEWDSWKCKAPVDAWTTADCTSYYRWSLDSVSANTARFRLNFVSMIFTKAVALGHRPNNPVAAVEKMAGERFNKGTISRKDCGKLLRAMRKAKRSDWCALTLLGWHTGHRIQDLLSTTATAIKGDLITIDPKKKQGKGRLIVLPIPSFLAKLVQRLGDLSTIRRGSNSGGKVSADFIAWLEAAGIDPVPVTRKGRITHTISFHSFRHSMVSRLTAAGVTSDVARMVTDHDSTKVHRQYQHAEVEALREALKKAR